MSGQPDKLFTKFNMQSTAQSLRVMRKSTLRTKPLQASVRRQRTVEPSPMRIKKRHSVMMAITGRTCLGMQHPTLEVRDDDWVDIDDGAAVENAELEFFSVQRHVASARSFNSYSSLSHMRLIM